MTKEALGDDAPDSVTATAHLLGRRWHPVVLHRLAARGPLGFAELSRSIEGIPNKTLSNCLDDLGEKGLVRRRVVSEKPFRVEYSLTDLGASLRPVLDAMVEWGASAVVRAERREDAVAVVP